MTQYPSEYEQARLLRWLVVHLLDESQLAVIPPGHVKSFRDLAPGVPESSHEPVNPVTDTT